jgi:hypothetical protein
MFGNILIILNEASKCLTVFNTQLFIGEQKLVVANILKEGIGQHLLCLAANVEFAFLAFGEVVTFHLFFGKHEELGFLVHFFEEGGSLGAWTFLWGFTFYTFC